MLVFVFLRSFPVRNHSIFCKQLLFAHGARQSGSFWYCLGELLCKMRTIPTTRGAQSPLCPVPQRCDTQPARPRPHSVQQTKLTGFCSDLSRKAKASCCGVVLIRDVSQRSHLEVSPPEKPAKKGEERGTTSLHVGPRKRVRILKGWHQL